MSDKCTHENIVHGASDYWPCPDCGVCFDDDQAFYILMEAKDRELKETQEQLEALKAENSGLSKKLSKAERAREACKNAYLKSEQENAELKVKVFRYFNDEECWIWQGDGSDHLESLVCPVVIHPVDLMRILESESLKADKAKVEVEAINGFKNFVLMTISEEENMLAQSKDLRQSMQIKFTCRRNFIRACFGKYASQLKTKEK